jgi:hypothetical protein
MTRLQRLETELGPYTMYGSGPAGASSHDRLAQQIELAHLRQQLGLPQETNRIVAPILRLYGITGSTMPDTKLPDRGTH